MSVIVRGHLCPCGLPAPPGLTQHPECATEALAARVRAKAGVEIAREQRARDPELSAAALAGRRIALAQVRDLARALRDEYRTLAQRAIDPGGAAATLAASVQRAAAIAELLERLDALDGGGE